MSSNLKNFLGDQDFLKNVGMMMYLNDNNNDGLLKYTTTMDVASKLLVNLDPKKAAAERRGQAYAKVAERINAYKTQNNGRVPNDAWLKNVISEEFGIKN